MVKRTDEKVVDLKEGHFDVLMNASNDLMIVFQRIDEEKQDPVFIYDGNARAFLCKNKEPAISRVFTNLPAEAKDALNTAKDILCVELDRGHIYLEYMARVEVRHQNG